jgi:hypothetical protein
MVLILIKNYYVLIISKLYQYLKYEYLWVLIIRFNEWYTKPR